MLQAHVNQTKPTDEEKSNMVALVDSIKDIQMFRKCAFSNGYLMFSYGLELSNDNTNSIHCLISTDISEIVCAADG